MDLTCSVVDDVRGLEELSPAWTELLERSATNELTLTPLWLLTWWRVFGPHDGRTLRVLAFHEGSRLVGLAPLCSRRHRYYGALPFRRLEFLASGESEEEEICSDYLSIIAERGAEAAVAEGMAAAARKGDLGRWDELVFTAMDGEQAFGPLFAESLRKQGFTTGLSTINGSPYIPLPATWEEYLARMPASRRQNLKRNLREFERWADGEAHFHEVKSLDQLDQGKGILLALHEERWHAAGDSGAFAAPRFRAFHDEVMPLLLQAGALDLTWLEVRGRPVAAKYNLVWRGKVYSYQEGRAMDVPSRVRLGIVSRVHAIQRAIRAGLREYDFLAGVRPYKVELALATRPVVEVRAVRPSLREWARRGLVRGVQGARAMKKRLRPTPGTPEAPSKD